MRSTRLAHKSYRIHMQCLAGHTSDRGQVLLLAPREEHEGVRDWHSSLGLGV